MEKAYVTRVEIFYCKNCKSETEGKTVSSETLYFTFGRGRIYPTYRFRPPRKVCANCGYPYIYSKGFKYKFICPGCGEKRYFEKKPEKVKCPSCGREYTIEVSSCFIASAVFSSDSYEVNVLRNLRDKFILKTIPGRYLIKIYYKFSPHIAERLEMKKNLRKIIQKFMKPAIHLIDKFFRL